jgi:hypothetical protein
VATARRAEAVLAAARAVVQAETDVPTRVRDIVPDRLVMKAGDFLRLLVFDYLKA